ncbi:MAG TPA: NAD-dependent succinate-semialdehyde dehydrogenase, partial [Microbacterium sp.]|nr:NAD-dependent succinate-semialdehyde dehydrogenase [Microbacterium sp.]
MTSVETDLLARVPAQLFIGGEWVDAAGGATFAVHAPSTGEVVREIADASPEDGIRALDAAVAAQDAWAATAPRERGEILRRAF